ncbi:GT2 family glycosyltransferase [Aeromicrobium sp. SORGH_AS981]|uniref:glycosyltransferase family 2 protein n=1 Tax=Aeromicrobium sp. SORGH_AS_0981 TaxID=3041802 RepID=UPI00285AAA8F|nr:glycosyltransferase family 2 protein [Aeromicrobium sp. SORGH_AS_0981]MDR6117559.1 GT2 family glycosyltransferase [Aeromicrobium sp. SORGH_AS_0981]
MTFDQTISDEGRSIKIDALLLNWHDEERTTEAINRLLDEELVRNVIVVDNESSGRLRPQVRPRVGLIEQAENRGFAGGINPGLRSSLERGVDAVLVINTDAYLLPGALERLRDAFEVTRSDGVPVGLIAPRVMNTDGSPQSTGGSFNPWFASTDDLSSRAIDYLTWACVLVPSTSLERIGLLDESFFMYWEDVDYGLRVLDGGLHLLTVPDAIAVHEKSVSHSKAGGVIDRYSARGLTVLCLKRRGPALWFGLPFRVAGRLLIRLVTRRSPHFVAQGVFDGVRAHRQAKDHRRAVNGGSAHDLTPSREIP